jgi:hypothetical protein
MFFSFKNDKTLFIISIFDSTPGRGVFRGFFDKKGKKIDIFV